jgi:hypothetical protein
MLNDVEVDLVFCGCRRGLRVLQSLSEEAWLQIYFAKATVDLRIGILIALVASSAAARPIKGLDTRS